MRLFSWSFPQTAPIVVSGILGVSRSSGHEPGSKDMQNKQSTGGGVPTDSLMFKLDKEIESVNVYFLVVYFSPPFLLPFLYLL